MSHSTIENLNLDSQDVLISPADLKNLMPISEAAKKTILNGRETVNNILSRKDNRLMMVIGPCSIHDVDAAMDYAKRLKVLADKDALFNADGNLQTECRKRKNGCRFTKGAKSGCTRTKGANRES